MSAVKDLTGMKFNYLTVLYRMPNIKTKGGYSKVVYHCRCDCGNEVDVLAESLRSGNTKACGCMKKIPLEMRTTHDKSRTRNYRIWQAMKQRCCNPNNTYYKNYGGRGITVCAEWMENYVSFYNWSIQNGYSDELTIDRIDNNAGYSPQNCRWVSRSEQMNNVRSNHLLTHDGKTMTISQWANELRMKSETLWSRLKYGWSVEDALTIGVGEVMNYGAESGKQRK